MDVCPPATEMGTSRTHKAKLSATIVRRRSITAPAASARHWDCQRVVGGGGVLRMSGTRRVVEVASCVGSIKTGKSRSGKRDGGCDWGMTRNAGRSWEMSRSGCQGAMHVRLIVPPPLPLYKRLPGTGHHALVQTTAV